VRKSTALFFTSKLNALFISNLNCIPLQKKKKKKKKNHFMFSVLLLCTFSQLNVQPTDCEICENGRDFGYIAYVLYGYQIERGEDAMREWCAASYPNDIDRCNVIVVDHYPSLAQDYETGYPRYRICPEWGYCPWPGANGKRRARVPVKFTEVEKADVLFAYLKGAKDELEVERLLLDAPTPIAAQARIIQSNDMNLILQLLQRNAKATFASYLYEQTQ
jgi:hypothetical protein